MYFNHNHTQGWLAKDPPRDPIPINSELIDQLPPGPLRGHLLHLKAIEQILDVANDNNDNLPGRPEFEQQMVRDATVRSRHGPVLLRGADAYREIQDDASKLAELSLEEILNTIVQNTLEHGRAFTT
jgi:hypothetical protein